MINRAVTRLIEWQIKSEIIQEEDKKIYVYGYTVMIEMLMNILLSLVIGVCLGSVKYVIFFLCMFIPLRSFCGGYHAKKTWKCTMLSNAVLFLVIQSSKLMEDYDIQLSGYAFVGLVCCVVIGILAPVDNKNKEIESGEYRVFKIITILVEIIELALGIVLFTKNAYVYSYIIMFTYMAHVLSLISSIVLKKFESMNEKNM